MSSPNVTWVWHYTSLETLKVILTTGRLRATEVHFLNDPQEPTFAHDCFVEALNEFSHVPETKRFAREARSLHDANHRPLDVWNTPFPTGEAPRYIFCASSDGDSLPAWLTYGSSESVGCAVAFDTRDQSLAVANSTTGGSPGARKRHGWTRLVYGRDQVVDHARERLSAAARLYEAADAQGQEDLLVLIEEVSAIWVDLRATAKESSFRHEKEWRVIVEEQSVAPVTFSSGPVPRPQIELEGTAAHTSDHPATPPLLPVRAVRLGPGASSMDRDILRWLLVACGYPVDGTQHIYEWRNPDTHEKYVSEHLDGESRVEILSSAHRFRKM